MARKPVGAVKGLRIGPLALGFEEWKRVSVPSGAPISTPFDTRPRLGLVDLEWVRGERRTAIVLQELIG